MVSNADLKLGTLSDTGDSRRSRFSGIILLATESSTMDTTVPSKGSRDPGLEIKSGRIQRPGFEMLESGLGQSLHYVN